MSDGRTFAMPNPACLAMLLSCSMTAAVVRPVSIAFVDSAIVNDSVIRLGDIGSISGLSERQTADALSLPVGESAPPCFNRFVSTDDVVRHWLANHGYAVDNFTVKRIRVRTAGQSHMVREYAGMISEYVVNHMNGKYDQVIADIHDTAASFKCFNKPYSVEVYGPAAGMNPGNAELGLKVVQGTVVRRLPVAIKIRAVADVAVAAVNISRGQLLTTGNYRFVKREISGGNFRPCTAPSQLTGNRARRTIRQGTMISPAFIEPVPMVRIGQQVTVCTRHGGLNISMTCVAREQGVAGQQIWVENPDSRKLFKVLVTDTGTVTIPSQGESL